jgi:prepilin-type N-terminal cleavage/methylation domain-containing protein
MRDSKGFTLVELMIVVAIIGVIAAMATSKFTGISDAASISEDMHNLSAFLKGKRLDAFTMKEEIDISINAGGNVLSATVDPTGSATPAGSITLNNVITPVSTTYAINSRGLFSTTGTIRLASTDNYSAYSCIAISSARVRLGEWRDDLSTPICEVK